MAKEPIFNLRSRKSESTSVVMIFHFKGHRIVMTTGIVMPVKYWNDNKQRAKENREFPLYQHINKRLTTMSAATMELWGEYVAQGVTPTADEFKSELSKRVNHVQAPVVPDLLPFITQIVDERKAMNRPGSSLQVYKNCIGHLEKYQTKRNKPLHFEDLNAAFLNDFTAYLYTQGFADSYAHKVLTTLKMFVRLADTRGIHKDSPLLKAKIEVKKQEKDSVYLTEAEIQHLFDLQLDDRLARVRDSFLIGCLTGLRFSDYTKIKPENIQDTSHAGKTVKGLIVTTQKTKQRVVLPLTNPMLLAVLERNGWKAPKGISNQKLNTYLKELAQVAGFTQSIEINEFIAGRHEKRTLQKWELISSHTARRSFATNAFKRGMPPADIMTFTGHTTVASFMKYIKVTAEERAVLLSDHPFFTGQATLKVVS